MITAIKTKNVPKQKKCSGTFSFLVRLILISRAASQTEMLARGADLAAVAAQLGHSNVATTGGSYAHVTAGSQTRAAALMPVTSRIFRT